MMKKILASAVLLGVSSMAHSVSPGGPNCGWGNMLLEGGTGLAQHMFALTTNGTSYNGTLGMTLGTNGCSVDGALTYGGERMVWFDNILDEYSTDVAVGDGEALKTVAVMFGIEKQDRGHFGSVMHDNFTTLFPSENVTSQEVMDSMILVMKDDVILAPYTI